MICGAYRLCKTKYNQIEAYNGAGAALYPGRWNLSNQKMIYTSDTPSLALLEMLVHSVPKSFEHYHIIPCEFDDSLIETADLSLLPVSWEKLDSIDAEYQNIQTIGGLWYHERRSVIFKVPSAVMPIQYNYLINPDHTDFPKISIGQPIPHVPDPRLYR